MDKDNLKKSLISSWTDFKAGWLGLNHWVRKIMIGCSAGCFIYVLLFGGAVVLGLLFSDGSYNEETTQTNSTNIELDSSGKKTNNVKSRVRKDHTVKSVEEYLESSPMFKEWLEIQSTTEKFKKDREWIVETYNYFLPKNRKWKVVEEKKIYDRIKKARGRIGIDGFGSEDTLFKRSEEDIKRLTRAFEDAIIDTAVMNLAAPMDVNKGEIINAANLNGYRIPKFGDWRFGGFFTERKLYNNPKKNDYFGFAYNTQGEIFEVYIPLGSRDLESEAKAEASKKQNIDEDEQHRIFVEYLREGYKQTFRELMVTPKPWVEKSISEIFQNEKLTRSIMSKLHEYGEMNDKKLRKENKLLSDKKNRKQAKSEGTWLYVGGFNDHFEQDEYLVNIMFFGSYGVIRITTTEINDLQEISSEIRKSPI